MQLICMQVQTMKMNKYVEIMDTTLRDGEQTPRVSYSPLEKMQLAKLLLTKVRVDRIEVTSARVSEGEQQSVADIVEWASKKDMQTRVEVLGFVDKGRSIDWIRDAGGKVINLLTKGSEVHCRVQLGKNPEEHYAQVVNEIAYAKEQGLNVNVYLEDWSGGMRDSFRYVYSFIELLMDQPVDRIMLPDTLGVMSPHNMVKYLDLLYAAFPNAVFDYHGHNDYGLATANSLVAVQKGINSIHTTVNGLGERTGNQTLAEIVAVINDMTDRKTRVNEKQLQTVSNVVQAMSGKRNSWNTPIVGSDVFTQTCGVHADGDIKGNLYANPLLPERFGRKRSYALGKLSGKASIEKNMEALGMELDKATRDKVLREVVRLGDKKKNLTPQDLPFIIADILKTPSKKKVEILDYDIVTRLSEHPQAKVTIKYKGKKLTASSGGDGGYDAFVKAVRMALKKVDLDIPKLTDYEVRIPPGGKTDALVETTITWLNDADLPLVTIGVDSDQLAAAVEATEKMLNIVL